MPPIIVDDFLELPPVSLPYYDEDYKDGASIVRNAFFICTVCAMHLLNTIYSCLWMESLTLTIMFTAAYYSMTLCGRWPSTKRNVLFLLSRKIFYYMNLPTILPRHEINWSGLLAIGHIICRIIDRIYIVYNVYYLW